MQKNFLFWMLIFMMMIVSISIMSPQQPPKKQSDGVVSYSKFMDMVSDGELSAVEFKNGYIHANKLDEEIKTLAPNDPNLISELRGAQVEINVAPPEKRGRAMDFLLSFGPVILLVAVLVWVMRRTMGAQSKHQEFGKSKAKILQDSNLPTVKFDDVAGIDEAKTELEEVVEFLKDPSKFSRLGGKIPKGVLLVGPPGTGKTLLARSVAGEAGVPFFSLSGSEFVEMYVGVGASRVRNLFVEAKKKAPCLVFIDEIDAVGRQRGAGLGGGHDEREQTLNQLLVELDGFETNEGIILIGATNRPDILDKALLRPGRFDRQVIVPAPDVKGREQILKVHSKNIPMDESIDMETIAKGTPGFSGADLANLVNEGALSAARANREAVTMADLEFAKDKVMMGSERKSMIISEKEKRITAYHEAGHTLAALHIEEALPVHKVSIVPRGRALGVTMYLPDEELHNETVDGAKAMICTLLAGRVAEEIEMGNVTSGASNDIMRATQIARRMVCEWGMSDKIGLVCLGDADSEPFLGRGTSNEKNYSEQTAQTIDKEVRKLLDDQYKRAKNILTKHKKELDDLSNALIEKETLDVDEIKTIALPS